VFARMISFVLLTAMVIAIPLSHTAVSKKSGKKGPAPKVALCHFPDDQPGHVIEVSANAAAMHIAKHGDCTDFVVDIGSGECTCFGQSCAEDCDDEQQRCRENCGPTPTIACLQACTAAHMQCLFNCTR
jgi:hypothetical protein